MGASQHSRCCEVRWGPLLRSAGISCLCGTCSNLHQQLMVLSRLSSCTMPLHWFPVIPLPENVFPEIVLPVVHLPLLQNNQIAMPALFVKVLPEMLRPNIGPRLFCVFNPGTPSMLSWIILPETERPVGKWSHVWSRIHKDEARRQCVHMYTHLLTSGKINSYAANTSRNGIACQGVSCNLQAAEFHVLPPPTARQQSWSLCHAINCTSALETVGTWELHWSDD